jgi:hypothetical protein
MSADTQNIPGFGIGRVEVVPTRPSEAELRKIRHLKAAGKEAMEQATFVVKIYLDEPVEPLGFGYPLYIGEHRIRKYTEFPGGIYFKIHNGTVLRSLAGRRIRFGAPVEAGFVDTGSDFPTVDPAELLRVSLESRKDLPTRLEALEK